MPTPTYEGQKVYWLPTAASLAAPTVANITAGTDLTAFTPVAGLAQGVTQNKASLAMLGDSFIKEGIGTWGTTLDITFVRIDTSSVLDVAWTLFTYNLAGYILVARFGSVATAARVEMYQVQVGQPVMNAAAENELQQFTVGFAVQATNMKAVVA